MVIYIDIDETICRSPNAPDYTYSTPIKENIVLFNKLYNNGHTIVYWTARGSTSGTDWSKHTTDQLKNWGVKYHKVKFDKPAYDIFIDDKNLNSSDITLLHKLFKK